MSKPDWCYCHAFHGYELVSNAIISTKDDGVLRAMSEGDWSAKRLRDGKYAPLTSGVWYTFAEIKNRQYI